MSVQRKVWRQESRPLVLSVLPCSCSVSLFLSVNPIRDVSNRLGGRTKMSDQLLETSDPKQFPIRNMDRRFHLAWVANFGLNVSARRWLENCQDFLYEKSGVSDPCCWFWDMLEQKSRLSSLNEAIKDMGRFLWRMSQSDRRTQMDPTMFIDDKFGTKRLPSIEPRLVNRDNRKEIPGADPWSWVPAPQKTHLPSPMAWLDMKKN